MSRSERKTVEDLIEALLAILDAADGSADAEEGGDMEPSLGWTIHGGLGFHHVDLEICEVAA